MAEVTEKRCDVFAGRAPAKRYEVLIIGSDGDETAFAKTVDLSDRALKRLERFIERGVHVPGWTDPQKPQKPKKTAPAEAASA